jgi:hypothetical protein
MIVEVVACFRVKMLRQLRSSMESALSCQKCLFAASLNTRRKRFSATAASRLPTSPIIAAARCPLLQLPSSLVDHGPVPLHLVTQRIRQRRPSVFAASRSSRCHRTRPTLDWTKSGNRDGLLPNGKMRRSTLSVSLNDIGESTLAWSRSQAVQVRLAREATALRPYRGSSVLLPSLSGLCSLMMVR